MSENFIPGNLKDYVPQPPIVPPIAPPPIPELDTPRPWMPSPPSDDAPTGDGEGNMPPPPSVPPMEPPPLPDLNPVPLPPPTIPAPPTEGGPWLPPPPGTTIPPPPLDMPSPPSEGNPWIPLPPGTWMPPPPVEGPPFDPGKLKDPFDDASKQASPIILDLDGDGVETIDSVAGVYFDHDKDSFAQQTGWVGKDDALLVRDINGNGNIDDGSELFGNNTVLTNGNKAPNGFEALADLDSNSDGIVDANDRAWNELMLWKDSNSNGVAG